MKETEQEAMQTITISTRVTPEFAELVKDVAPLLGFRNTSNLIEAAIRFYLTSHGYAVRFTPPKAG